MEISLRDERGQGIVEYILVLVVAVSIILGAIYQLNSAFKVWANNYFGNYLACLLETGELPSLGGPTGKAGVCNEQYKPFSLTDGRPLLAAAGKSSDQGDTDKGSSHGARENRYGSGNYTPVGSFGPSFTGRGGGSSYGGQTNRFNSDSSRNTGNMQATSYGVGGSSFSNSGSDQELRTRINNEFAFDQTVENEKRRDVASIHKNPNSNDGHRKTAIHLKSSKAKRDVAQVSDTSFTIANFIRFLIIAALILALVLFLGGQALNISKSMDGS